MSSSLLTTEWGAVSLRLNRRCRHVRLKVLPPGRLEVVAPPGFDRRELPELVRRYHGWIAHTMEKVRARYAALAPPDFIDLPAVGEGWQVEYRRGEGLRRHIREAASGKLILSHREQEEWRPLLQTWLKRQAREALAVRLAAVAAETGLTFSAITIRGQRTRWGSCSSKGRISLNFRLLFLTPELVRYLLIHELCHTVHLNHSPAFWALVAKHQPDYRALDGALRRAGEAVPVWAAD